ncbi:hypothetical protein BKA61DRAFT_429076, partial [Leptodontidium sp. MPI-SDFR-AT-0119]
HHRMREIAARIQDGANRSFPNDLSSRYRYDKVYALLICWADEDPRLPVSIELNDLSRLFSDEFGFQAETWQIPTDNCHNELSHKVLDFIGIGDDNRNDLKIVYYGGHGILTKGRQLAWTNIPNKAEKMFRSVKWSGIQNTLEEAQSDILTLLDCCASGTANTDEGRGTTELVAACGFNASANPVGAHSFTRKLITELHLLRYSPPFTVSFLFNCILRRLQMWMPEDRKLQKAPLHILLTPDKILPRSIQLVSCRKNMAQALIDPDHIPIPNPNHANFASNGTTSAEMSSQALPTQNISNSILQPSSSKSHNIKIKSQLHSLPYLALHIWMNKSMSMNEFPIDLFSDWLRMVPVLAQRVQVETGFNSGFAPLKLV